jgi:hypothetical protein
MTMPKIPIGIRVRYTPQLADARSIELTQAPEIWVLADVSKPEEDVMDFAAKMPDGTLRVVQAMCRDFTPMKPQATLQPMAAYTHLAPDGTRHPARKVVIDEVTANGVVLRDEEGGHYREQSRATMMGGAVEVGTAFYWCQYCRVRMKLKGGADPFELTEDT